MKTSCQEVWKWRSTNRGQRAGFSTLGDVHDALLVTEGRILGELARCKALPKDYRKRIEDLFLDRAEVDLQAITEAHRWIQAPFLKGLIKCLRIEPLPPEGGVQITELSLCEPLSLAVEPPRPIFLKQENLQWGGSPMVRGVISFLVGALLLGFWPPEWRLLDASSAPYEESLLLAARILGFSLTLERGANTLFVPGSDHPLVAAGLGTIGLEIDRQMRSFNTGHYAVLVPAGSGTMLSGISLYFANRMISVLGVPSETRENLALASHGLVPGLPVVLVIMD